MWNRGQHGDRVGELVTDRVGVPAEQVQRGLFHVAGQHGETTFGDWNESNLW